MHCWLKPTAPCAVFTKPLNLKAQQVMRMNSHTLTVTFLGTGSADLYPAPFCNCENCDAARTYGGSDLRSFSCALICDDLLIDCPPDVISSAMRCGISLMNLKALLITHSHPDHLSPTLLLSRRANIWAMHRPHKPTTQIPQLSELAIYANECSLMLVRQWLAEQQKYDLKVRLIKLKPFEPYQIDEATTVHAMPAAHCIGVEDALIFALFRFGRCLLYAVDTGFPNEETLSYMRQFQFDAAVVDATYGVSAPTREHMNIQVALALRQRMLSEGMLKEGAPFVLTHISPHWTPPHHAIANELERKGVLLAHDGMRITL
ncbi:MAG: MBL fold metallo-hydrolase [Armatimonadota bacterium]|nr:MBL fold metallo-hydrolase [Armatimonadota bacterium]MCX7777162.1 MBL fold metallo-hydrolase [Armatimonadota bacterium]MDW8024989.1 MBL fold metallo-hydrolase [Armatimonadota bacterium]